MGQRSTNTEGMSALERLQFELDHPPFHGFLKPEAVAADTDRGAVEILLRQRFEFQRVPDKPEFHGGVIAALIDMAAHAAVAVSIGRMAPTIDLRIDYMRLASDTDLHAHGRVRRVGRTLAVADVEILNDAGKQIALGRGLLSTNAG